MSDPTLTLQIKQGQAAGQQFAVSRKPKTIGRGADCEIVINDGSLAFEHARLRLTDDGYVIDNLTGLPNIFVNDKPVDSNAPLQTGDSLRLGEVTLRVERADPQLGGAEEDATLLAAPPPAMEDQTIIPAAGAVIEAEDRTMVPPVAPSRPLAVQQPVAAPAPAQTQTGDNTWKWIVGGVIVVILGIGGMFAYREYAAAPPPPTAVVEADTPTPAPTETPTPEGDPTATPVSAPLEVPGLALAALPEQARPDSEATLIDPFCNSQVEVDPETPVILGWQQRLADPAGEIDYVAQWLASAHYDLSLDGRPITNVNYEREGTTLTMWANLGLLGAGEHYLSIEQFSSRPVSTGLDLDPADGTVDEYSAGPVAEGFCELTVPAPTAEPSATPSPTPSPTASPTDSPTPTATKRVASRSQTAAPLGIFQDFEANVAWKRGDQPNGTFTRNSAQAHSGTYAGKLAYDFPTNSNDYVVFLQNRPLSGRPNGITAWVYGDGQGHFLNAWLKDSAGQTWQMSFGPVEHTGWQQMTAFIDPGQPWPSGHISGSDNGAIDYPISFSGLTLDDGNDSYSGRGTIYVDDLSSTESAQKAVPTPTPPPASQPVANQPPAQAPTSAPPSANSPYVLQLGQQHRYEEPWGAPRGGGPCQAQDGAGWDDKDANYRGFNVELILTNNSTVKVTDTWPESIRFFIRDNEEVDACPYEYTNPGPVPGGKNSVTFFTVVPKGDFVRTVQLTLNGQTTRLCLDGGGGAWYC